MEQQMKIIADAVNEIMRQTLANRDEIERLRDCEVYNARSVASSNAEIERLRARLQDIADFPLHGDYSNAYEMPKIAVRALEGKIEKVSDA